MAIYLRGSAGIAARHSNAVREDFLHNWRQNRSLRALWLLLKASFAEAYWNAHDEARALERPETAQ